MIKQKRALAEEETQRKQKKTRVGGKLMRREKLRGESELIHTKLFSIMPGTWQALCLNLLLQYRKSPTSRWLKVFQLYNGVEVVCIQ